MKYSPLKTLNQIKWNYEEVLDTPPGYISLIYNKFIADNFWNDFSEAFLKALSSRISALWLGR